MGALLQPRQISPNSCTGSFQYWTCQASSTQRQYSGCCSIDACQNGGTCPLANQPPTDVSTTSSTRSSTTSATRSTTSSVTSQTTTRSQVPEISSTSTTPTDSTATATSTAMTTSDSAIPTPNPTPASDQTSTSTSPTTSSSSSSSGSSNPAIIGGAVAGLVVLLLILLGIGCLLIRRKRQRKEHGEDPPYGPVYSDKPSGTSPPCSLLYPANLHPLGIMGFFSLGRNKENRNSMASASPDTRHSFFPFKKRPAHLGPHPATRKETGIHLPPPDVGEMPSPSFPPPRANVDLPYDRVELESDVISAPSELSSTPLGGYRGSGVSSGWSPTPELPSDVSFSSTAAVLSPQRETHYSEASSSQTGSRLSGSNQSGSNQSGSNQGGSNQGGSQETHDAPLRGGGWPIMRSNMHSLRRPVPNQNLQQVQGNSRADPIGGPSGHGGQAQGGQTGAPPPPTGSGANRHVLSWMSYDAEDQSTLRPGGVVR